jgi:prophage regulatory protein
MASSSSSRPKQLFDPDRAYSAAEIAQALSLHPITPFKWVRAGRLPKPVRLAPGTTRWLGSELNEYLFGAEEVRHG